MNKYFSNVSIYVNDILSVSYIPGKYMDIFGKKGISDPWILLGIVFDRFPGSFD